MATTDQEGPAPLDDADQQRFRQAVPSAMLSTPYLSTLGLVFEEYEPDRVTARLAFRDDLTNDGIVYHGGVIAAAMDSAGAAAAWSNHDFGKGTRASTVAMSVQYVGAAKSSDLLCRARVVRRGRELIFTEITATDEAGTVAAHALQTYRIV
ncbi:MAG TPA: PaaI family thioesterase [Acidimicrobiales bacterium]|nr:PaaI family thioesterase [Acidimicrobiales bacterium]